MCRCRAEYPRCRLEMKFDEVYPFIWFNNKKDRLSQKDSIFKISPLQIIEINKMLSSQSGKIKQQRERLTSSNLRFALERGLR